MIRASLIVAIILTLLIIDFFEFHDLLEPKTLPELLTGLVSVPIIILLGIDLLSRRRQLR